MRPYRFVYIENSPFDYVNVFFDENRLVCRLLMKYEDMTDELAKFYGYKQRKDLLTLDKLAYSNLNMCSSERYINKLIVKIDKEYYFIAAEQFINRNDEQWQRSWTPSSNIVCGIKMSGHRCLVFYEKGIATSDTKQRTNQQDTTEGITPILQIWTRSPTDTMTEVSKSIIAKKGTIISNLRERDAIIRDASVINATRSESNIMKLHYKLEAPQFAKPNETFVVKVVALDYYGNLCEEVTQDGFVPEVVDGYLPHQRCSIVNGRGEFRVTALGLLDGETMRIKFGKKCATGLAECIVQIRDSE